MHGRVPAGAENREPPGGKRAILSRVRSGGTIWRQATVMPETRTSLNSSRSMAGNCRSLPGAAARCWWSTPPRFAATRRNTAISKPCGGAIASAASSFSASRPTISAQQEPGSAAEIKQFCETNYQVDFPLTEKYRVIGGDAHPFYRWVAAQLGEDGAPRWNFHKYLIGPDGQLAGAWPSRVGPLDPTRSPAKSRAMLPKLLEPKSIDEADRLSLAPDGAAPPFENWRFGASAGK